MLRGYRLGLGSHHELLESLVVALPHWFSLTSLLLRQSLIPLVLQALHGALHSRLTVGGSKVTNGRGKIALR
jgi:hypothetical protein